MPATQAETTAPPVFTLQNKTLETRVPLLLQRYVGHYKIHIRISDGPGAEGSGTCSPEDRDGPSQLQEVGGRSSGPVWLPLAGSGGTRVWVWVPQALRNNHTLVLISTHHQSSGRKASSRATQVLFCVFYPNNPLTQRVGRAAAHTGTHGTRETCWDRPRGAATVLPQRRHTGRRQNPLASPHRLPGAARLRTPGFFFFSLSQGHWGHHVRSALCSRIIIINNH